MARMLRKNMPRSELANQLRAALEGKPGLRLAVLFGSAARGKDHGGSDLDIGVLFGGDTTAIEADLHRLTGRIIDLIDLAQAPPLLRFEIARDGLLLIEEEPHAWADFKVRAMHDWWDFEPLARRFNQAAMRRLREKIANGPS